MPRQAPHALDTAAHHAGRIARGIRFVVWVETDAAKWIELDAESAEHATVLAENWIRPELGARGASTRSVDAKGRTKFIRLHTPPQPCFDDEEAA